MIFTKAKRPEPNRLIKCYCYDWSPYTAIGMFIPFKKGSGKRTGQTRFCRQLVSGGPWSGDKDTWLDVETWEYMDTRPNAVTEQLLSTFVEILQKAKTDKALMSYAQSYGYPEYKQICKTLGIQPDPQFSLFG